ncbi:MAG: NOB1 family endonuclease [Petrotogales bacterium]
MKKRFFIIDTSAILSGKPINLENANMLTTPSVSDEIQPGGMDYRIFKFLQEKGLVIQSPSKESVNKVKKIAEKTGDKERLSPADIDILALALDVNKNHNGIILTDDYSIQNVAAALHIKFQSFSQRGITKRFKWHYRCPGCGKQFKEWIKICPICGTETKILIDHKNHIK